jgi:hypothetical protein
VIFRLERAEAEDVVTHSGWRPEPLDWADRFALAGSASPRLRSTDPDSSSFPPAYSHYGARLPLFASLTPRRRCDAIRPKTRVPIPVRN